METENEQVVNLISNDLITRSLSDLLQKGAKHLLNLFMCQGHFEMLLRVYDKFQESRT